MLNKLNYVKRYGNLLPDSKFNVVVLHPLADQEELLIQQGLEPEQCRLCDMYWVYRRWIFFVSLTCSPEMQPFASYHVKPNVRYGRSFYVVTQDCPISTEHIDVVLSFLSGWIDNNSSAPLYRKPPDKAIRITTMDIALLS